ncbi:PAS domain S-box protein [Rubinisphaera margarita]|uniref:PAS domain S-box protein n=1 Tax=Rubinisphaera margarita TaxID=2909586 RepID=UPI001EE9208F|nr:PAS domain S-box protein [Rubinisphaera margarita]MCG6154605.1 PAS domain S-box protein [Rubinisphaera margarita]
MTAAINYIHTRTLVENSRSVAESQELMVQLEGLLSNITDAETGQRGFLLTLDESYLDPYESSASLVHSDLRKLEELLHENETPLGRLPDLNRAVQAKLDELRETIDLAKDGDREAALVIVQSDVGKRLMDEIRTILGSMQETEAEDVRKRLLETEQSFQSAVASAVLSTLVGVALLGFVFYLALRNIRQEQAATAEMTAQRELYLTTLASIGDAVISTNAEGDVVFLNTVAESLTGWTTADASGRPLTEVFRIINETTRATVENPALRAIREGVIVGLANHTLLITRDGQEVAIDDSAAPIRDDAGEVIGSVLVFRDISSHKFSVRRLEASEARMRSMLNSALDGIISIDHRGNVIEFNKSAEKMFGYTRDEVLGNEMANFIVPPSLRGRHRDGLERYLKTGVGPVLDQRLELTAVRRDGEEFPVEISITRIETVGPPLFTGYVRDITQTKFAEQQRQESERRFRMLVEQIQDYAIFMMDPEGRATSWNVGVRRLLGYEEDEFIGLRVFKAAFTPEDLETGIDEAELRQAATEGRGGDDRWKLRKDGSRFWASGITTALHDEDGNLLGFMKVMRDQTDRKRLEDELRKIAADLSEADRRKTEFLATLGHELRNPLAPIRTGLEVMKLARDEPETIEEVRLTMERQTHQMMRLIDDLLDVSRITRGKLELRRSMVLVGDVVGSAVEAARPFVNDAQHELTVELPEEPIEMYGDPHRLAQVFSNLLNNAAKYTPVGGHIWLTVRRLDDDVVISVRDNGLGIPAEMQESIFEMFTQIDRPHEFGHTGLGIGLTLVKRLIALHGGTIEVKSDGPDHGSEFTVRLPVMTESAATSVLLEDPPSGNPPLKVLVVDDNEAAASMLSMVVSMLGNEVRIAHDGSQAVQVASQFRPEVILMDLGMPNMNGFEAAREIRKQEWGKTMVLAALTGWGQDEDRRRSREAGFDHHFVKPAEPAELQRLFAAVSRN